MGYIPQPGDIKYVDQPDANGNCDGIINTNDRVYMGYPEDPEIVYGFGPSMKYKNWEFSIWELAAEPGLAEQCIQRFR